MKTALSAALFVASSAMAAPTAAPPPKQVATFALLVGANQSVDASLAPLKYADDDATRYQELFRSLGARTYLLTRPDDNTRRLHPQAVAEAQLPTRAQFDATLKTLSADVAKAKAEGLETIVYFTFAGHGSVRDGRGYITLEDTALSGPDLDAALGAIPATQLHLIVDACASYFLAYGRGPGGARREVTGLRAGALADDPRVGLLLSTSSAKDSHEWEAFEGGVFSHEVRSGLYGAADADQDGIVSYREIAAFVSRANASVPNERYRPDFFARAPKTSASLADLRQSSAKSLTIDGAHAAHYFLETGDGVRVADLRNAPGQALTLRVPRMPGAMFLRDADAEREYRVDGPDEQIMLSMLTPDTARARARSAAHESFGKLFAFGFDAQVVAAYKDDCVLRGSETVADLPSAELSLKQTLGWGSIGMGAMGAALGGGLLAITPELRHEARGVDRAEINRSRDRLQDATWASFLVGGAFAAAGATLLLLPETNQVRAAVAPGAASLSFEGTF